MLKPAPSQQGMTLIEALIAVSLLGIMLAVGLPSLGKSMQNRQIRTAASAVQNGLQIARTEALRRNRVVKFQLNSDNSWAVGCDSPDTTVQNGEQACPEVLQSRDNNEGSRNASVAAVQNVAGTSTAASSSVFTGTLKFTPFGRVTPDTLPPGNLAVYQVSNPVSGTCAAAGGDMKCLSVVVTPNGQIRMCDPTAATGDPRAC